MNRAWHWAGIPFCKEDISNSKIRESQKCKIRKRSARNPELIEDTWKPRCKLRWALFDIQKMSYRHILPSQRFPAADHQVQSVFQFQVLHQRNPREAKGQIRLRANPLPSLLQLQNHHLHFRVRTGRPETFLARPRTEKVEGNCQVHLGECRRDVLPDLMMRDTCVDACAFGAVHLEVWKERQPLNKNFGWARRTLGTWRQTRFHSRNPFPPLQGRTCREDRDTVSENQDLSGRTEQSSITSTVFAIFKLSWKSSRSHVEVRRNPVRFATAKADFYCNSDIGSIRSQFFDDSLDSHTIVLSLWMDSGKGECEVFKQKLGGFLL